MFCVLNSLALQSLLFLQSNHAFLVPPVSYKINSGNLYPKKSCNGKAFFFRSQTLQLDANMDAHLAQMWLKTWNSTNHWELQGLKAKTAKWIRVQTTLNQNQIFFFGVFGQTLKDVNSQIIWRGCMKISQNCFRCLSLDHPSVYIILITISFHIPNKNTSQPTHQMYSIWMGRGVETSKGFVLGSVAKICSIKNWSWSTLSTSTRFSG